MALLYTNKADCNKPGSVLTHKDNMKLHHSDAGTSNQPFRMSVNKLSRLLVERSTASPVDLRIMLSTSVSEAPKMKGTAQCQSWLSRFFYALLGMLHPNLDLCEDSNDD